MKSITKEDLSLTNYIKNYVLREFIETETAPLTLSKDSSNNSYVYQSVSSMHPLPTSRGRGWCYLDNPFDTTEQQNSVVVHDRFGAVVDPSNYIVDYLDGRVIFADQSIIPVSVSYRWHYISVLDEWNILPTSQIPVVVIDISGFKKEGFQFSAGKRVPRDVVFHIFATDTAERDVISESIYDGIYLQSCPNQQFPQGYMIEWDGTWNQHYEYAIPLDASPLKFEKVDASSVTVPLLSSLPNANLMMLDDINRFRGRVKCVLFHWEEGW